MNAEERAAAKRCLAVIGKDIAEIDEKLNELVDRLVDGTIIPTMARVQEINLRRRREIAQRQYNAVHGSIPHF